MERTAKKGLTKKVDPSSTEEIGDMPKSTLQTFKKVTPGTIVIREPEYHRLKQNEIFQIDPKLLAPFEGHFELVEKEEEEEKEEETSDVDDSQ